MNKANREKILPHLSFYKLIAISLMFLFTIALLTACGGGGGGGGDTSSVNTGTFIDAPVQGLEYQTATQNGTTDSQASFKCETGEQITFSIGNVVLGTTLCKSIITPLDLVPGAADETDPTVTNILRLLQSLDDDCDLNTIHITPQIASEVSGRPINFNTSVEDFDNGEVADLFNYLSGLGVFTCDTPRELRSAEEAQEHFRLVLKEPINPEALTALFTVSPENIIVFEAVTFNASQSTGNITEYVWDFGDGQTGSGVEANHTFSVIGTYLATLTVINEKNNETNSSQEIVVNEPPNQPPIASFTPNPTTGMAPQLVSFVPTATDPDGTITQYFWEFGDGFTINGRVANHTYHQPGTYLAQLTVTDDDGAQTVVSVEVVITSTPANQAPTASFTATPETGETSLQVSFDASGSSDLDGTIASYSWNFGDGQTGAGATRNHLYSEAGTYLAKLTVTDNDGATAETTKDIIVFETVVDADCSTNPCDDHATCDDSGAEIICRCNSGWTGDGLSCSIVDECENNDTLPNGGTACGLNNRGEFGQRCVDGAWQDNPGTCTDPDVCTDDSFTEGSSACGFNGNGTLMQVCEAGQWTDSDDCDDPDVCVNNTTQKGSTPCSGGYYIQLCENGQWSDTTDCALDDVDEDGDLVDAGDDPNDADNTVCGDSDSDGCDDCSISGVLDPANDGWDENGDGACELPLDYDCMNGANAATDPYRLQACIQFTYVNQDRDHFAAESDNAAPLEWNEDIWEVAIAHTIDMCENVFFAHTNLSGQGPSNRAAAAGLSYGLAENIAINLDPGAAQYLFMEEPTCVGHRANVLEPRAIEVGIGYHFCENPNNFDWDGYQFVTQNFRWDFSIDESAYCQDSSLACQIPPNPPTTAPCPDDLIAWGFCPVPSDDTLQGWGCN